MKAIVYKDDLGKDVRRRRDPRRARSTRAEAAREHLIEAGRRLRRRAAWSCILEDAEIPVERLKQAHPQGDARDRVHPGPLRLVLQEQGRAAAARRGHRATSRRRSTCRRSRASSPQGRRGRERRAPAPTTTSPFAALAFKIMTDPYVGKLTYFRVYSGKLEAGGRVLNVTTGKTERIGRILMMHANDREEIEEVYAGDIAAGVGLKQTVTGDTLCAPGRADRARADRLPRAGHRGRDRAEDQGRPGEDVGRARPPRRGGPDLPGRRPTRRPARP